MTKPGRNFEGEPRFEVRPEAGINLCAYFDAMPDAKLRTFDPGFSDKEVMRWDENFKSDSNVVLPCTASAQVDVAMYRRYIAECIRYRDRVREGVMAKA